MYNEKRKRFELPVMIMRGGTSKGAYIVQADLPKDQSQWDPLLLRLMGSPDTKQIDGLGGSQSVTSKVAIVQKSARKDADVDYTFAQVSVDKPIVSYKGNCGNISSGVGPFAIEKGMVKVTEGINKVRIYNTNTDKIIISEVQVKDGNVVYQGDYKIAGVPNSFSPIKLRFVDPSGTMKKGLLPTGNVVDVLDIEGYDNVEVSIIDAANPLVFVKAKDLGLTGKETDAEINNDAEKLDLLERVRGLAAVKCGLIEDYTQSHWLSPTIPKMTFVSEAEDYIDSNGNEIKENEIDLLSRMMSMQKAHPSYAMTGAMCTAAACALKGSVVQQVLRKNADLQYIRIGHSSGIMQCGVNFVEKDGEVVIEDTFGYRSANLLCEGVAFLSDLE